MSDSKPYIVSARKYRPSTFSSVVGQESLTRTLKNAVGSGRLAQAYLFTGPRGVGKTSCARIFAKTINCEHPTADGEACGECESCRAIDSGTSFNIIELDAASNNSVDDIRELTRQVNVAPSRGRYRVFIIDEVHMLSSGAFNAFLKTLEEPPSYVIFILATTEKHKVIPTILSRCQIYDFKRITVNDMVEHLKHVAASEGIEAEEQALDVVARKADGAMRDALSIFDQVSASSMGHLTYAAAIENLNVLDYDYYFRLIDAFHKGDVAESLMIYKEIRDKGFDSLFFINGLMGHVRDLMVAADPRTLSLLEVSADVASRYNEQARLFKPSWYYSALKILNDCDVNYRTSTNKQLVVELALIRLCRLCQPPAPGEGQDGGGSTVKEVKPATSRSDPPSAGQPSSAIQSQGATAPPAASVAAASATQVHAPVSSKPRMGVAPKIPGRIHINRQERRDEAAPSVDARHTPFTDEQFVDAWRAYALANESEKIMVNAMRAAKIESAGDGAYRVVVRNPAEYASLERHLTDLVRSIRERLVNDDVQVSVAISEDNDAPKHLAPHEFLKKISQENPSVAAIIRAIDGEFA